VDSGVDEDGDRSRKAKVARMATGGHFDAYVHEGHYYAINKFQTDVISVVSTFFLLLETTGLFFYQLV
jgi:hypothetical protein